MPLPSSPLEVKIDPTDGGSCYPSTSSGDTLRWPNSGIVRYPQTQDRTHNPNPRLGPYAWNNRLFGVFVDTLNNHVEVWSSTDGETWAEEDADNHLACDANTGYDETTEPLEYGTETCAVATNIARDGVTVPEGDVPTLFIATFNASRQLVVGEFDLQSRAWVASTAGGYDAIASTQSFEVSPILAIEYVPANDECLLFWSRASTSPENSIDINRATYVRDTSISTASDVATSGSTTRQLATTCSDYENSIVYVFFRGSASTSLQGVTYNSSYSESSVFSLGSGADLKRSGPAIVDSDGKVWVSWLEETTGPPYDFKILVASSTSSATPSWSTATISDENRSSFPCCFIETTDNELYLLTVSHTTVGQTGAELVVVSHAYDRGLNTWGSRSVLVDTTGGFQGSPCFEFAHQSVNAGAYTDSAGDNTFGVFFDRGTGSTDTSETDPRGTRYDAVMPVWFYGDSPEQILNLYTPNGPYAPYIL